MKKRVELYLEDINVKFRPQVASFIIEFWKFIADLAAKKEEIKTDHFLTTAFLTVVVRYYEEIMKEKVHGILYPSPITKNEGINLVLLPDTVDQFFTLECVFMVKFERGKMNPMSYEIFQCSEMVPVLKGEFNLKIEI